MLSAAWAYRGFILSSIRNEYRARFVRSKLGLLWMIVHPLVNAAIFAVVLSEVMGARLPGMTESRLGYAIYVTSGILAWSLFAEVVTRCLTIFIESGGMLQKLYFPRICLPLIVTGVALLNNFLMFAAILVVFAVLGHWPRTAVLWIPLLMAVPLALGLGLGLLFGIFNVFARDIGQAVPVILQLLFWFTPVIYVLAIVPEAIRPALRFNPMTHVVKAYQDVFLVNASPDWAALAPTMILAAALLFLSLFVFRRAGNEFVDAL